jgi:chromosome segregation ATPase
MATAGMTQPYCELHDKGHHTHLHDEIARLRAVEQHVEWLESQNVKFRAEVKRLQEEANERSGYLTEQYNLNAALVEKVGQLQAEYDKVFDLWQDKGDEVERLRAQLTEVNQRFGTQYRDKVEEVERLQKNETMLVETAKNRLAEVERLRAEVENMERVVGLAQREYADLQHERDTYRAAAMGEENLRKEVEANVKWLQTALAAETADKFKHIAEVKRLNYELGVVDYPGKGALVETNERLRKRLDAANSVWQDEEAALLRIRDGVEKFVADFVKSKPRSSNTVSALRHRELVDWAKRDLERILEGSSDE